MEIGQHRSFHKLFNYYLSILSLRDGRDKLGPKDSWMGNTIVLGTNKSSGRDQPPQFSVTFATIYNTSNISPIIFSCSGNRLVSSPPILAETFQLCLSSSEPYRAGFSNYGCFNT